MTREELERLKRRFGAEISAWPAPYRQKAQIFRGNASEEPRFGQDAHLDRLVFEAALMEKDERELARKILMRIGQERRTVFGFFSMMSSWRLPVAAASFGAVFFAAGLAGYSVAGSGYGTMDDALLAIATGEPAAAGIETGLPKPIDESAIEDGFL